MGPEQRGQGSPVGVGEAMRALALAFTDPDQADDELQLAEQLLAGVDIRASRINAQIAALVRDAGQGGDWEDRAALLRSEISIAGLASVETTLELAVCFHHAVRGAHDELDAGIARLRRLTRSGNYAYYTDIAHFMGDRPLPHPSTARWIDGEDAVRDRWRALVAARRALALP
ncbi:hypothetical protein [Streptomyces sp. NPDC057301]|uniref:hypothetical protein n=1 Tax=Streptomyces sp. NPDC057301 TaxID=3346093 RepID=UPI003628EA35